MKTRAIAQSAFLIAVSCADGAFAGVALFANATDTIQVSSGTTLSGASTYEARILFTADFNRTGIVFDEWTNGAEDKALYVGPGNPGTLRAFNWPVNETEVLIVSTEVTLDVWHHVAVVFDGSEERMYLDGGLVGSRAATGTIGNSAGLPAIGAISRLPVVSGFGGYIDWLRVSDISRYSGPSFPPPVDQPASDASTQLLFYFDEAPGGTTATDQS
ncbi:MAG TPA: LamG domain-containing protein, partial [Thermoanaerobaculaceae bacterium]|nr:LamG domain-containing protein [Thermoanaerobaculaceae bacterium]